MARMIPDVDPGKLRHRSEKPVYLALRDLLPEHYTVIHSFSWISRHRAGGALAEGEADFVILHRSRGLLVLEVKGGRNIRYAEGRWFRRTGQAVTNFQDPFLQAQGNMHKILGIVEKRSGGAVTKRDFTYGYAVVFPNANHVGALPPHADPEIVITEQGLRAVPSAIERAFSAWGAERPKLGRRQFDILLNDCLMPRARVVRRIGPELESTAERLLELTEQQAVGLEGLYGHDRVLVEGSAGSGKTLLALQRSLSFARTGRRALLVCYNKALAAWLRRQIRGDPGARAYSSNLTVKSFHALAREVITSAGLQFEPSGGGQAFWDERVPELLEEAVVEREARGDDVRYDALVVDEAQDFPPDWWLALTDSLLRARDSPVYAFMDPNQSLRGEVSRPPVRFEVSYRLSMNCRNTRKIAVASASLLGLESRSSPRAPAGPSLKILRASTVAQRRDLVLGELRRLVREEGVKPHQIALIAPGSKANSSLCQDDEAGGVPLTADAPAWYDGRGILVTTSRAFKGLEADIVILFDLGGFSRNFRLEDLYVACTRAKSLLIAVVHRDACQSALENGARLAEAGSSS